MTLTRIYADEHGDSHFGTVDIVLNDAGDIGSLSAAIPATGVIFRTTPPDYDYDWHPAPCRQLIILLDSEIEITTSDGQQRRFKGGEVILVEDTWGRGHKTRTTDGQERRSVFVTLA